MSPHHRKRCSASALRDRLRRSLRTSKCSALCASTALFLYSLLLFLVSVPLASSVSGVPHPSPAPSPAASSASSSDDASPLSLHAPIPSLLPCYGVYELKGRRHYMEDTHAAYADGQLYISRLAASSPFALELGKPNAAHDRSGDEDDEKTAAVVGGNAASAASSDDDSWFLFGVFDGHGGHGASTYVATHLLPLLHAKLSAQSRAERGLPAVALPPPSSPLPPSSPSLLPPSHNLSLVFQSAFQQLDAAYLAHPLAHHRSHAHADGSTAIVVAVERRDSGERVLVANAGDCRALLVGEDTGEGKELTTMESAWPWMNRMASNLCSRAADSDSDSEDEADEAYAACANHVDEDEDEDYEVLLDDAKTAEITAAELLQMYHHFHPARHNVSDAASLAPSSPPSFLPLSVDHKPHMPVERSYITSLPSGFITTSPLHSISRVQGVLATSRAIGDYELKPFVRCDPDVVLWEDEGQGERERERERRMTARWLVIASDGFFDAFSSAGVSGWVREMGGRGMGVQHMAKELVKSAYRKGSDDNITVVIVDLHCLRHTPRTRQHEH